MRSPATGSHQLVRHHWLKIFIQPLGVKSFTYNNGGLVLGLDQNSPLIGQPLVDLVQQPRAKWKLTPQVEVVRQVTPEEWALGSTDCLASSARTPSISKAIYWSDKQANHYDRQLRPSRAAACAVYGPLWLLCRGDFDELFRLWEGER